MIFETADKDDIKELVELRVEYLSEDYGEIPQSKLSLMTDKLPVYFCQHLNKDLFVFVCRSEGMIAGCCFLCVSEKPSNPAFINGKTGTVMNVYTRQRFRRKGIAKELIRLLLIQSEKLGLDLVELKATDQGYDLYKKLGFEDVISKYHAMKYIIDDRNRIRSVNRRKSNGIRMV